MMKEKDVIIEALHIIKEVCESNTPYCENCPFWDGESGQCIMVSNFPHEYKITDNPHTYWRAFDIHKKESSTPTNQEVEENINNYYAHCIESDWMT